MVLFDACVCVCVYVCMCLRARTPQSILDKTEKEKKSTYSNVCEEKHVSFTLLYLSVDGLIGNEAKTFFKELAKLLADKIP